MGTSTSTTSDEYTCSECGATFGDAAAMEDHYFTEHLVSPTTEARTGEEVGESNEPRTEDSTTRSRERSNQGTEAGERRATDSESASEASLWERLSDLFFALFVLVLLGIPAAALVLVLL